MDSAHSTVRYRYSKRFPGYRVGDDGSVWSCLKNRWGFRDEWKRLKPGLCGSGYYFVTLCVQGEKRSRMIHQLVLEAFIGRCPPGLECCHKDDNKTNNHLTNLRWDTRKANRQDAIHNGSIARGSRTRHVKLTEEQVREIRKPNGGSQSDKARRHGVSVSAIHFIMNRKHWKWVI